MDHEEMPKQTPAAPHGLKFRPPKRSHLIKRKSSQPNRHHHCEGCRCSGGPPHLSVRQGRRPFPRERDIPSACRARYHKELQAQTHEDFSRDANHLLQRDQSGAPHLSVVAALPNTLNESQHEHIQYHQRAGSHHNVHIHPVSHIGLQNDAVYDMLEAAEAPNVIYFGDIPFPYPKPNRYRPRNIPVEPSPNQAYPLPTGDQRASLRHHPHGHAGVIEPSQTPTFRRLSMSFHQQNPPPVSIFPSRHHHPFRFLYPPHLYPPHPHFMSHFAPPPLPPYTRRVSITHPEVIDRAGVANHDTFEHWSFRQHQSMPALGTNGLRQVRICPRSGQHYYLCE